MKMYVANATRQVEDFVYRIPGDNKARRQTIHPGQQVELSGDLTTDEADAVIEHHGVYGMTAATELGSAKGKVVRLIYSLDKPVPANRIEQAMRANVDVLVVEGKEMRERAAVIVPEAINHEIRDRGLSSEVSLSGLEMSVVEEEPKGGYGDIAPVAEGYRIGKTTMERSDDRKVARGGRRGR